MLVLISGKSNLKAFLQLLQQPQGSACECADTTAAPNSTQQP